VIVYVTKPQAYRHTMFTRLFAVAKGVVRKWWWFVVAEWVRGKASNWVGDQVMTIASHPLTTLIQWISGDSLRASGTVLLLVLAVVIVASYLESRRPPEQVAAHTPKRPGPNMPSPPPVDPWLREDSVEWQHKGRGMSGRPVMDGPFCPTERARLQYLDTSYSNAAPRAVHDDHHVGYHGKLVCPECHVEYELGGTGKQIGTARGTASARYEARLNSSGRVLN